jgi:type I restriction enzyme S subunit
MSSEVRTLASVCTLIVDCAHKTAPASAEPYAYAVGTKAIRRGRIDFTAARPVDQATYAEWVTRAVPRPGDLILCREAPVGPVAKVPERPRVCLGQRTVLLRPDESVVEPTFLYYALSSPAVQAELMARAEGSTVPHLNVADVRTFPLPLPSLETQRRAVRVLGLLDHKIDSCARIATMLEALVASAFESATAIASTPTTLGQLGVVRGGGTPKSSEPTYWNPPEIVWMTPKDMTALAHPVVFRSQRMISNKGLANSSAKLVPKGTVLLTSRATIGSTAIAYAPLATNQGFITVEPSGLSAPCVLFAIRSAMDEIHARAHGSTFPEINKTNFRSVSVSVPSGDALSSFEAVAVPAFDRMASAVEEARALEDLKDLLLPKLLEDELAGVAVGAEAESVMS